MKNFKLIGFIGLLTISHLTLSPSEWYPNWQPTPNFHEWLTDWQPGQSQGPNQEYSDEYLMKLKEELLKESPQEQTDDEFDKTDSTEFRAENPALAAEIAAVLEDAVIRNDAMIIPIAIQTGGANPNQTNAAGEPMIHVAVRNNNADAAVALVRQGANFFIQNNEGQNIFEIGAPSEITALILETFNQMLQ